MDYQAEDADGDEWRGQVHVMAGSALDADRVEIVIHKQNGELAHVNVSNSSLSRNRLSAAEQPANVVEVLVPAVLQRKDETPFPGRIGLLFGREEAGGDWIFLGGAIHDLPPRTPLAPLPL